jgi:integrase
VPDGLSYFRTALKKQISGLTNDAEDIILASRKQNTNAQYNSHLKKWTNYCQENNISPYFASITDGLNFLASIFKQGQSYSSINTARSALSSVIILPSHVSFGANPLVQRFMKGIFNQRPCLPRYTSTWDVNKVLLYLNSIPLENILLKDLSYKCVTLLALLSGQRLQTIKNMQLECLVFTHSGCEIYINKLLKTSKPGKHLSTIRFSSYENMNLCIVKHLQQYKDLTNSIRKNQEQLFISFQKPFKAVSTDTLSRWIKIVLKKSNIDTTVFGAHSTRAASTSKAAAIGAPIDTILAAAGWSNAQTFAKYYNRPVENSNMDKFILQDFQ